MRDILQAAVFLVLVALPPLGLLLGWNDPSLLAENRLPAQLPDLPRDLASLRKFPERFEAYFGDHFGLRTYLIRLAKRAEPVARGERIGVTAGKEGWLYYGNASDLGRYRCVRVPEEEREGWRELARSRRRWFRGRGITFVWAMAPNKHTVYPEYLPDDPPTAPASDDECDLHEIGHELSREGVDFLDLRPLLLEEKRRHRLYHRTDTHWNQLGALHAARAILERIGRHHAGVAPPGLGNFEIGMREGMGGGNLATFFVAYGEAYREDVVTLRGLQAPRARPAQGSPPLDPQKHSWREKRIVVETDDSSLPTAVMFHDSFGYAVMPILAEHFRRIIFVRSAGALDAGVIEAESPDAVILLTVEARFMQEAPQAPDLRAAP